MKTNRKHCLSSIFSLALLSIAPLLFLSGQAFADERNEQSGSVLRVVMDNNYPPYVFAAADGGIQGILVDQWRLFAKKTGIRVEVTAMDWGDAIESMAEGEFDVIDTIFKTEERTGWLDYSRPYARLEVPVFFNSDISGISDISSLQGFAVAAKKGDAAFDLLRRHGVDNLMLFTSYEEIIEAARDRKVNVFVVDKPPALYFLHKFGIVDKFKQSAPLYVGEIHRAVRKGDSSTLRRIEDGFARITPAELERIERKWYGTSILGNIPVNSILGGLGMLLFLVTALSLWNLALRKVVESRTRSLKANEERYRLLFNAESDAIAVIDVESQGLIEVNKATVELYGYSHEELLTMRITDLTAEPEETIRQLTSPEDHFVVPLRYHRKKNGQLIPVEITARFFQLEGQRRLLAAMRDISVRLKAEEDLRENRRFLEGLIENSGTLIFVKDHLGRYTLVNRKWEEVIGLHRDTALGRTDQELFPGESGRQFRQNDMKVMESGQVFEAEEVLDKEQERKFFLSVKFPLRDNGGAINGICGMSTEITVHKQAEAERKRLHEQLAQAGKMESIGRLAGGIAHDFNNMLGVILGHIELAMLRAPHPDPLQASLKEIEKAARRSADLTRQLLAFARKQPIKPRVIDLNKIVSGMLTLLRRLIGEDIELVWLPGDNLWPIRMDPSQLDQILANLAANARDAIDGVGKIVITTENIHFDAAFCLENEGCQEGDFVILTVSDTGCGMDDETRAKVFEPFYTTKEIGKGVGLGLAMVYGIVSRTMALSRLTVHWARAPTSSCSSLVRKSPPPCRGR